MFNLLRPALVPAALVVLVLAVLPASAKVVGEPKLTAACAATAAKMLAMDESDVLTLPTELSKGTYYVNGQVSREDGSLMMIECKFDSKKQLTTLTVDGKAYKVSSADSSSSTAAATGGAPKAATQACVSQMGGPVKIEQVSPLRPGYYEIIMKETKTPRRVACTVNDAGALQDWVEMN